MNGTAANDDPRLRILIETLDDCRQFHLDGMRGSRGEIRGLHEQKAGCFAAMLAEIGQWQAQHRGLADGNVEAEPAPRDATIGGDFNALVRRINRIYDERLPASRFRCPVRAHGQRTRPRPPRRA